MTAETGRVPDTAHRLARNQRAWARRSRGNTRRWRRAPLACRTDGQGRAIASVDTDGNGDGWDGSRFDPLARASANSAPAITNPGSKAYAPGQTIEAFGIAVSDADGDTVTVGVSGLPAGLTWSSESGTVAADAAVRAYPVTVTANDGANNAVTSTFTITITVGNVLPTIVNPGNKAYAPGQMSASR